MALWSHPDSGYLMSPQLCNELADLETVVAIKYSVPRPMYAELTRLAGDRIQVSTASEENGWTILELNWQLYLCSSPPYLIQTARDRRMHDYTQLAFAGKADGRAACATALTRCGARCATPASGKAAFPPEILAGAAGPDRRARARAAAGADRG